MPTKRIKKPTGDPQQFLSFDDALVQPGAKASHAKKSGGFVVVERLEDGPNGMVRLRVSPDTVQVYPRTSNSLAIRLGKEIGESSMPDPTRSKQWTPIKSQTDQQGA